MIRVLTAVSLHFTLLQRQFKPNEIAVMYRSHSLSDSIEVTGSLLFCHRLFYYLVLSYLILFTTIIYCYILLSIIIYHLLFSPILSSSLLSSCFILSSLPLSTIILSNLVFHYLFSALLYLIKCLVAHCASLIWSLVLRWLKLLYHYSPLMNWTSDNPWYLSLCAYFISACQSYNNQFSVANRFIALPCL